ncbi:hypothetical protein FA95DRAFT_1575728 [Auriscalpium vulgare]|uniref:Uncharacterized protein n=1 Tax=Auriscalpium vulgare TaxID=40419 RepID=A0ACB8RFT2_9AGAM|nr:hypothetical protein FA95DRAFT_1575728 [Auriscalpium vulgare]
MHMVMGADSTIAFPLVCFGAHFALLGPLRAPEAVSTSNISELAVIIKKDKEHMVGDVKPSPALMIEEATAAEIGEVRLDRGECDVPEAGSGEGVRGVVARAGGVMAKEEGIPCWWLH